MSRTKTLLPLLIPCLLLVWSAGCRRGGDTFTRREQLLMGTSVTITIAGVPSREADEAADRAFAEIRRIEAWMSSYLPESDVSRINRAAGKEWTSVHAEVLSVLQEALHYGRLSGGAFDITVKPLSRLWRFEPESRPPDPGAVQGLLDLVDFREVRIDPEGRVRLNRPGMAIGLGGIAKGYAVDRAAAVLREAGIRNAIVNAGGDLRILGRPSAERRWRIGVQDPDDPKGLLRELELSDTAVATSGDYERFFVYRGVRYHHILDPRTGFPARGCRSVTVTAPSAMTADAAATAVFVMGPGKGMEWIEKLPRVEGMIVTGEGHITMSAGFREEGVR